MIVTTVPPEAPKIRTSAQGKLQIHSLTGVDIQYLQLSNIVKAPADLNSRSAWRNRFLELPTRPESPLKAQILHNDGVPASVNRNRARHNLLCGGIDDTADNDCIRCLRSRGKRDRGKLGGEYRYGADCSYPLHLDRRAIRRVQHPYNLLPRAEP